MTLPEWKSCPATLTDLEIYEGVETMLADLKREKERSREPRPVPESTGSAWGRIPAEEIAAGLDVMRAAIAEQRAAEELERRKRAELLPCCR